MKKNILIFIALLCSTICHAKFYKAILYLTDGSNKTGFAQFVETNDSKVYFKAEEEAKTERISSNELIRIVYTYNSGQLVTMDYLYLTSANIFSKKISKSKNKSWFNILYSKEFKIGRIDDSGSNINNNFRASSSSYFFEKNGKDQLVFGYNTLGNVAKSYSTDARVKKMAKEVFTDCPKMLEAIEKETFELNTALYQLSSMFDKIKCN